MQQIVKILADCDRDALLVLVKKAGPACHLGGDSCFNDTVYESDLAEPFSLEGLYKLIEGRKTEKKEGSYTSYLFEKGLDKILKNRRGIGRGDNRRLRPRAPRGNLLPTCVPRHVLMVELGISPDDVRHEPLVVIDKKIKQEDER